MNIRMCQALVGGLALSAGLASAETVEPVGATAFTETMPEGETIIGARIELPGEIAASALAPDTFSAHGFDVIATYVNDSGEWQEADPAGTYVFVEFSRSDVPGDGAGRTLMYYDGLNHRQPIEVMLRHGALTLENGDEVTPGTIRTSDVSNPLFDSFEAVTFADSTGFEVQYRLYVPEGYDSADAASGELPLVLFLHGSGEGGDLNDVQLLANPSGLEFATPEAQAEHPAFVMVPQSRTNSRTGGSWATNTGTEEAPVFDETQSLHAVLEALDEVIAEYPVDESRIYGTGLSQGSRGIWIASILHPDLFAAQLHIASADIYTDEQLTPLADRPIWSVVAVDDAEDRVANTDAVTDQLEALGATVERRTGDDALNGFLRGYAADQEVADQRAAAEAAGANVLLSHFVAGTIQPSAHWSWMYAFNNDELRDWLFSQSK